MVNPPRSVDPLVVGKVIGDVVDMFVPVVEFSVEYGSKQISNGVEIKPAAAAQKPRVHIQGSRDSNSLYTLRKFEEDLLLYLQLDFSQVMADPDAPSPSEPTFREWLHWIITDIAEGGDASEGRELMEYMGPQPPTGIHRYVFTLFRQTEAEQVPHKPPERRANFKTRQFASENGLGLPVAALYFNSQKGHAAANKKH